MTKVIDRNKPVKARLILEALASRPRLNIVNTLISKGPLSASEISNNIGISLSTIMDHLKILNSSGILRWKFEKRGGKPVKVYSVDDIFIELKIDLRKLSSLPDFSRLGDLVRDYIDKKLSSSGLPLELSARDIMRTLDVDMDMAISILDYIHIDEDCILDVLRDRFLSMDIGDSVSLDDLSGGLNIHSYWALKLAIRLGEEDGFIFKDGRLYRVT
jgi:DNA-binding transcriptional ArsR family regulator